MSKIKTAFFCSNCGYESAKWIGRCPSCNEWNTFVEELISKNKDDVKKQPWRDELHTGETRTISLNEVKSSEEKRVLTQDAELNRVLGGGIVPGSIVLIAGEPGIGKSTLFLQSGLQLKGITTLSVS